MNLRQWWCEWRYGHLDFVRFTNTGSKYVKCQLCGRIR